MKWKNWRSGAVSVGDGEEFLAIDERGAMHLVCSAVYDSETVDFLSDEETSVNPVWICHVNDIPRPAEPAPAS